MEKRVRKVYPALLLAFALSGCYKREPICSEISRYAVRFEIDSANVLYMMPEELERIQFSLYDPDTEKEVFRTYFSEEGGNLYSITPGTYKVAAWSLNSDYTSVTYTDRYNLLTAESKTVQETPICVTVAPDHVFAYSSEEIIIPYVTEEDAATVFNIPLKSVTETWRIETEGIDGLENLSDASFFIYNQTREVYFKQWERRGSAIDKSSGRVEGNLVVSEFGTFGMPQEDKVCILIRITAQNGFVHEKTVDVSEQIRNPDNSRHIIKISFGTKLNPLKQGGLQPYAEEWNENTDKIDLI